MRPCSVARPWMASDLSGCLPQPLWVLLESVRFIAALDCFKFPKVRDSLLFGLLECALLDSGLTRVVGRYAAVRSIPNEVLTLVWAASVATSAAACVREHLDWRRLALVREVG